MLIKTSFNQKHSDIVELYNNLETTYFILIHFKIIIDVIAKLNFQPFIPVCSVTWLLSVLKTKAVLLNKYFVTSNILAPRVYIKYVYTHTHTHT